MRTLEAIVVHTFEEPPPLFILGNTFNFYLGSFRLQYDSFLNYGPLGET
jgi:hypothetical protein